MKTPDSVDARMRMIIYYSKQRRKELKELREYLVLNYKNKFVFYDEELIGKVRCKITNFNVEPEYGISVVIESVDLHSSSCAIEWCVSFDEIEFEEE